MKKIISLALAGSMLLSFATTGSAAAAEINKPMTSGTIGGGWVVSNQTITDTNIASFQLSDDNAYSLPYSLKLTHETKTTTEQKIGIKIPVTLEQGAKYKIRFKATAEMGNGSINKYTYFGNALGWSSGCKQYSNLKTADGDSAKALGESGWYQNEFYYTAQGNVLYLSLATETLSETDAAQNDHTFTARYFDDFEIYKVTTDESDNEVLTPVEITDASFDATAPATGTNVTDSVSEKTAYFTNDWKNTIEKGTLGRTRAIDVGTEGATGKYSARLVYEGNNEEYSYIRLWRNTLLQGNNSKNDKYKVEFKAKGSTSDFWVGFGSSYNGAVNVTKAFNGTDTVTNVTVEELDNGWKKLTVICDGTTTELKDTSLVFQTNASTDLLIDDVSVYNMTDSAEVTVSNNSFEKFDFDNGYDINSPIANGSKNRIVISWYNPKSVALTDVQILENGAEIAESASKTDWSLDKNAHNSLEVTGLTAGDVHTYTIRAYTSDTEYTENTVTATVGNGRDFGHATLTDGNYAEDWAIQYTNGTNGENGSAQTGLYLDNKIKYSGDYALRVEINEDSATNTFALLGKKFATEAGKKYEISYMGKSSGVANASCCFFYDTSIENKSWTGTKIKTGTTEWEKYTREYIATGDSAQVFFNIQNADRAKSIWIDDVQVREVLSDGTYGENILNGGGFEKEVTNLKEKNGVLSWDKDGLYYDYVNIYEKKVDGTLEKVNETEKVTGTSYLLKDSLGEEKTFVVKTVLSKKAGEIESEGVEITVDGKYRVSEAEKFEQVTFDGDFSSLGEGAKVEKTLSKLENGNIMASITIINQNGDRKLPVKYFAALYNGDVLEDVVVMDKTIGWRGEETLKAVLKIEDTEKGDYKIKTFLWDNGFLPLKDAGEITE